MRKISLVALFLFAATFVSLQASVPKSRSLEFDYEVIVKDIPPSISDLKIWMPCLAQTPYQIVEDVVVDAATPATITYDKKYNNKIFYYSFEPPKDSSIKISAHYKVKRLEYSNKPPKDFSLIKKNPDASWMKYLSPDKFVTVSPQIKELAVKVTEGKNTTVDKARAIYDYVFTNVSYDKTIPGWGNGDTERVCRVKAGNCTDFHSLFISLARASGIPAKFVIGTSIPKEKEGQMKSYHCWAEFYDGQFGWIPVDISEAWKDKTKHDYYFGAISEDRLEFTHGRDIILEPSSNSEPLNYFIYPYAEADGKVFNNVDVSFKFKEKFHGEI